MVILGSGRIGTRLARLAMAFGMHVTGVRRTPGTGAEGFAVTPPSEPVRLAADVDVLALTCQLTPETEGLVGRAVIGAMKPSTVLVNVARGRVVDEAALTEALREGRLAGAGLDCFHAEPMPPASPLWSLPDVVVTPHSTGRPSTTSATRSGCCATTSAPWTRAVPSKTRLFDAAALRAPHAGPGKGMRTTR